MKISNNTSQVDILVPERCCQAVYHRLCQERSPPKFARVITSLGSILQGDFFQEYIKKGSSSQTSLWGPRKARLTTGGI